MRRIVVPAGYGATHPVAEKTDKKGRALNRRVDVKILVNKGLQGGQIVTGCFVCKSETQRLPDARDESWASGT